MASPARPEPGRQPRDMLRVAICGGTGPERTALLDLLRRGAGKSLADHPDTNGDRFAGIAVGQPEPTGLTWHYFETLERKFVIVDIPEGEQPVGDAVAGLSVADVAVILASAAEELQSPERQLASLASLLRVETVILAVTRMDEVGFRERAFDKIDASIWELADSVGFDNLAVLPITVTAGDNVLTASDAMPWHDGSTLAGDLRNARPGGAQTNAPIRLPVQRVAARKSGSQGVHGSVAAGRISSGETLTIHPSGEEFPVAGIRGPSGELAEAVAGQAVALLPASDITAERGDLITSPEYPPMVSRRLVAWLIWLDHPAMLPGRVYSIRLAAASAEARLTGPIHHLDLDTGCPRHGGLLEPGEVGLCMLSLDRPLAFDSYHVNRHTGAFLVIDRSTNATAGAGLVNHMIDHDDNVSWQQMAVDKSARASALGQRPRVVWLTGLSGAGKSTIADRLEQSLHEAGTHTYVLDGDNLRQGINRDLGFDDTDRVENIRRAAEVARLMVDAGLVVIVSMISPFRAERHMARELMDDGEFIEVFVDTPLSVCEQRDHKNLYSRARRGEIRNFTGIDSPYEAPETPELTLKGAEEDPDQLAARLLAYLDSH